MYKICPSCGSKNSVDDFLCHNCMSDISNVSPVDESKTVLTLKNSEITLQIEPNDILGRENKAAEYLKKYPTVSRRHCQFFYENGKWYLKDLQSTNKTYINGEAIEPLKKVAIKKGDELSFSKSLKLKVED